MKIASLILLILFTTEGFCQSSKDIGQITQLLVKEYAADTIRVYHKFNNRGLIKDIEEAKSNFDFEKMKEVELMNDSLSIDEEFSMFDYNIIIEFEGLRIKYYESEKQLKRVNKKKLKKYCHGKYQKRKKKIPIAFISSPLISDDGRHAIVYCSYVCGPLCGSGGIQFLKLVNNKWEIDKYEMQWIS